MAMNKKERELLEQFAKTAALRWTAPVEADVPPPKTCSEPDSVGWSFNAYAGRVSESWSDSVSHGSMPKTSRMSGSQGKRHLFSSKLLALRAMRHVVEHECAARLRGIDQQIEEAEAEHASASNTRRDGPSHARER